MRAVVHAAILVRVQGMATFAWAMLWKRGAPDALSIMKHSLVSTKPCFEKVFYLTTGFTTSGMIEKVRILEMHNQQQDAGAERMLQKLLMSHLLVGRKLANVGDEIYGRQRYHFLSSRSQSSPLFRRLIE